MIKYISLLDANRELKSQKMEICALVECGTSDISLLWLQIVGKIPSLAGPLEVLKRSSDMMRKSVLLGILVVVIMAFVIEELVLRRVF